MKQDKAHMKIKLFKNKVQIFEQYIVLEERVTMGTNTEHDISFEIELTEIERDEVHDYEKKMGFGEKEK